jgi:hypothetical protein
LVPLLDKVLLERKNIKGGLSCDDSFWNSMVKRGGKMGSGGFFWMCGWINILMPFYRTKERNEFCEPYSSSQEYAKGLYSGLEKQSGPRVNLLHMGISEADVLWASDALDINLEFKSGFVGA